MNSEAVFAAVCAVLAAKTLMHPQLSRCCLHAALTAGRALGRAGQHGSGRSGASGM